MPAITVEELRTVRLAPGDVIVAKIGGAVTCREAQQIKETLRGAFPDNEGLVVSGDVELEKWTPEG